MRIALLIATATLATGCAAPQGATLYKAGATEADFKQAMLQCDYEVSAATQVTTPGFRSAFGEELDRSLRKRELMMKCMNARGFLPQ